MKIVHFYLCVLVSCILVFPVASAAQTIQKTVYKNSETTPAAFFNINDVAHYVIQVHGGSASESPSLIDVMSNNQQYIANSAIADNWSLDGGTAAWFGPTGRGLASAGYAGPVAPATDGGFIPVFGDNSYLASTTINLGSQASTVTFTGGGDGYWPIYWKTTDCQEKVMVKNHHSSTFGIFGKLDSLKCWNLTTNQSCNDDLTAINSNLNYGYTYFNGGTVKIGNRVYTVDKNLNFPVAQFNCIDLNPSGSPFFCPGYPVSLEISAGLGYHDVHGLFRYDQANNRIYWAMDNRNDGTITIYALDPGTATVSSAVISEPSVSNPAMDHDYSKAVFLTNNRLVMETGNGLTLGTPGTTLCIDLSTWPQLKDCNPANAAGVFTHYGTPPQHDRVSPLLNNAGVITGFCSGLNSCYDLNGAPVPMPAGYIPSSGQLNNFLTDGTKVLTMAGYSLQEEAYPEYVYCYDFATNTSCGSTNGSLLYRAYGMDWRVPGKCFLTYGDKGTLTQWGLEPGGLVQNSALCLSNACGQFSETIPDPATRFCGPQTNNIQYSELKLTNLPAVHSGSMVSLKCGGSVVATYGIPANATSFVQNISGVVNHAVCNTPEISVYFPNIAPGLVQVVGTEVSYTNSGRFPEICYDARFTDCNGQQLVNTVTLVRAVNGGLVFTQANTSVTSACIPVPVTLTDFTASSANCESSLTWHTAEELNFESFEVQRNNDGSNQFTVLGTVKATGSNSSYHFTDKNPVPGKNFYRLKMIDIDGKFKYSDIKLVLNNCHAKKSVIAYPNPVTKITTVAGLFPGDRIRLFNVNGQVLLSRQAVKEQEQIDFSNLPAGVYSLNVNSSNGAGTVIKLLKQ